MNRIFLNQQACDVMTKAMKKHGLTDQQIFQITKEASWVVDPMALELEKSIVTTKETKEEKLKLCDLCKGKGHIYDGCPLVYHRNKFAKAGIVVHALAKEPQAYLMTYVTSSLSELVFVIPKNKIPIVVGIFAGSQTSQGMTLGQDVMPLDLKTFADTYKCHIEWLTPSLSRDVREWDPALYARLDDAGLTMDDY